MPTTTEYVERVNALYIMNRQKYILQKQDGSGYATISKSLHDGLVKSHLQQKITLGCFAGADWNKFICFDIDCKEGSKEMAVRLIECLIEQYGIDVNQILVSDSGGKGYHVEIFFDMAIAVTELHLFYELVLEDLKANKHQIEFRNTINQAVKLPLSINRKTGRKCCLLDTETLEPVADEHLFTIQKIDTELFREQLDEIWSSKPLRVVRKSKGFTLETDVAEEFEQVRANVNFDLTIDYEARIIQMLEQNSLLYPSSRHNSTILLATFFKEQGYEQEDTQELLYSLLSNTWHTARHLYSKDTTIDYIESETARLVDIVYEKDYKLGSKSTKPIRIYKGDVLFVLKPKKLHMRQLLFTMLCHSKKYASKEGSFYMTYKQMSEMGNTTDRGRLAKYIGDLEKEGLLDVLRRNERKEKSHLSKPNMYRMAYQTASVDAEFIELDKVNADDFGRVTAQLLTKTELKQLVTAKQFRTTFQEYYTS